MKIVAFVASRLGSTRVPFKNVRLINGKPLFYYLLETALKCKKLDEVYINTDSEEIIEISKELFTNDLKYYKRPEKLGTSSASLDDYVYEFLQNIEADIVIFLNPCSPLLKASTIDSAIEYFIDNKLSSLTASEAVQTHAFKNNKALNFSFNEPQPRSQDLDYIHLMTSGFFIWNANKFKTQYEKFGYSNFIEPFESYPLGKIEALDIDEEDDWILVESFMNSKIKETKYHNLVNTKILKGEIKVY
jgi:CMP-N-acetylneuraminic acid synthetase